MQGPQRPILTQIDSNRDQVGEALDLLEGPNEDAARSLSRVKVLVGSLDLKIEMANEAKKDGKEGWVTVKGPSASNKPLCFYSVFSNDNKEIRARLTPKSRRSDLGREAMIIVKKHGGIGLFPLTDTRSHRMSLYNIKEINKCIKLCNGSWEGL